MSDDQVSRLISPNFPQSLYRHAEAGQQNT